LSWQKDIAHIERVATAEQGKQRFDSKMKNRRERGEHKNLLANEKEKSVGEESPGHALRRPSANIPLDSYMALGISLRGRVKFTKPFRESSAVLVALTNIEKMSSFRWFTTLRIPSPR